MNREDILDKLPSYLETSGRNLEAAYKSLSHLKAVKPGISALSDSLVQSIIEVHCSQLSNAWILFEFCKLAYRSEPSKDQIKAIMDAETNGKLLQKVIQEIFELIKTHFAHRISSILQNCDPNAELEHFLKTESTVQFH